MLNDARSRSEANESGRDALLQCDGAGTGADGKGAAHLLTQSALLIEIRDREAYPTLRRA